jgi:hypothetical protein
MIKAMAGLEFARFLIFAGTVEILLFPLQIFSINSAYKVNENLALCTS